MKHELADLIMAPTDDRDFVKKYAISVLAAVSSPLLVPAVIFLGFLAELISMRSFNKRNMPEWNDPKQLASRGLFCAPALIYLLPGAIVIAIGAIAGSSGGGSTFFGLSMLSIFIILGGLILSFLGNAVAFTAIHTYIHSKNFGDLFNIPTLIRKLKEHGAEMTNVFGLGTIVTLVLVVLNSYFGFLGAIVSLLGGTFLGLYLAGATGAIYGRPETSTIEAVAELEESVEEKPQDSFDEWVPDSAGDDDTWNPN